MIPHIVWLITPNRFHVPCKCRLCHNKESYPPPPSSDYRPDAASGYSPYHPGAYYQYQPYQAAADYYRLPQMQHGPDSGRNVFKFN